MTTQERIRSIYRSSYYAPFASFSPFTRLIFTPSLLALTPSLSSSNNGKVCSSEIQASVIDTPYLRPAGPSGGTACLPSLILDSIMTPHIIWEVAAEAS